MWWTMKSRGSVTVSGFVRALVLFGVLAGVLAMHALTMNHDAAMAAMNTTASPVAGMAHGQIDSAGQSGYISGPPRDHGMSAAEVRVDMPGPAASPSKVAVSKYQGGSGQQMGAMCLAILAASLLLGLALMLGWLRSARFALWLRQARQVHLSPLLGRSPPWLEPSLSKLCVLRT
jgi:hypothetical protein